MQHRVAVIGAGLAGLAAAWELEQAGHDVTVLEARSRPGGRVRTLRDPFADELYAEVGAVAFSSAYEQANRYIDELGLERADYAFPTGKALYHIAGRRFAVSADEKPDWPYELKEEEKALGPIGILANYLIQTLPSEISAPESWMNPPLADLDKLSLAEYMRQQGASEGAVKFVADTQYFGADPENTSALSLALTDIGLFFSGGSLFVLAGGNDHLPRAMARRLSRRVQYGVEVTDIRTGGNDVEIKGHRGDHPVSVRAERVVVTLPAPVLSGIRIEPALPAEKVAAVRNLPYRNIIRTPFQIRSGFWHDEGVSGAANTDLFVGRIDRQPYSDPGGPEKRAILEAFMEGRTAARLEDRPPSEIQEYALTQLEKVHPGIRDEVEGGYVKVWSEDPYTRGTYSWPGPGDVMAYLEVLQRPHERIHFAGEHTSVLRASMEGALRSGVRAAQEVDVAASG